jgi:hypothetical protein
MADVAVARQRCLNHPAREAVARCTVCSRYYCRECVVESDERLVCATCLKAPRNAKAQTRGRSAALQLWIVATAGFLIAWTVFYLIGLALLMIPSGSGAAVWGAL